MNEPIRCACGHSCQRTVCVKRDGITQLQVIDAGVVELSVWLTPATARALIAQLREIAGPDEAAALADVSGFVP